MIYRSTYFREVPSVTITVSETYCYVEFELEFWNIFAVNEVVAVVADIMVIGMLGKTKLESR